MISNYFKNTIQLCLNVEDVHLCVSYKCIVFRRKAHLFIVAVKLSFK